MIGEDLIRIPGYDLIGIQKDVCRSRPTLIGHRLEPRHLSDMTVEEILDGWPYLSAAQIAEVLRFIAQFPETLDPERTSFPDLEKHISNGGYDDEA